MTVVMEGQLSIFDVLDAPHARPARDADGWRHAGFHVHGDVLVPIRERDGHYEIAPTTLRHHRRHFVWPQAMERWPRPHLGLMGGAIRPLPDARGWLGSRLAAAYDHSSGLATGADHMASCLTCHETDTATNIGISRHPHHKEPQP